MHNKLGALQATLLEYIFALVFRLNYGFGGTFYSDHIASTSHRYIFHP